MKRLAILGSTGSVGENALDVARRLPGRVRVEAVAARGNAARLAAQCAEFGCAAAACADPAEAAALRALAPPGVETLSGPEGVAQLAALPAVDMVVCAIVGAASLAPTLAAVRAGKQVALASKEALVMAGCLVMAEARRSGARVIPVDSEHCALFQCLDGRPMDTVSKLILTASGGPFRGKSPAEIEAADAKAALAHPTWSMGPKVTIDSATLMNKALEMVEARWLFDVDAARIDVLVHPQSIVHSLVEFNDGSMLAQLSAPDMRLPLLHAMTYPEKISGGLPRLSLAEAARLDFHAPDRTVFPSLDFAWHALRAGGTAPAAMNAANEVAVERFIAGELRVPGIWRVVEDALARHTPARDPSLDDIMAADAEARARARAFRAD